MSDDVEAWINGMYKINGYKYAVPPEPAEHYKKKAILSRDSWLDNDTFAAGLDSETLSMSLTEIVACK